MTDVILLNVIDDGLKDWIVGGPEDLLVRYAMIKPSFRNRSENFYELRLGWKESE